MSEEEADRSMHEGPAEIGAEAGEEAPALQFVMDVPLRVSVEVGSMRMLLQEVLQLDKGSVVELDRSPDEPADLLVNGRAFARGELTVVDQHLAVRIVEMLEARSG